MSANVNLKPKLLAIGGICTLLFFSYAFMLMQNGHFHEDAYILFIYVDNLVNGNGISFYPGGPNAEGATDFLWMMMLSALAFIGFDAGTAAMTVNAIGAGIVSALIAREILKAELGDKKLVAMFSLFVVLWAMQTPLLAAVGGFSVYMYMALVLMTFVAIRDEQHLTKVPYLAIVVALFRPDGVIIGVAFTLIGLYKAKEAGKLKPFMLGMAIAFVIGVSYFIWRYSYFGQLLPLPLYVKGHTDMTAGLRTNLGWGLFNFYLLLPFALMVLSSKKIKHIVVLMLPLILLFVALATAKQSQNIGYRFQAPILIVAYLVFVQLLLERFKAMKDTAKSGNILAVYLLGFVAFAGFQVNKSTEVMAFNYINQAPFTMANKLPGKLTIAVTEAGRFPYWNQQKQHTIVDLVGLNSVHPATNLLDVGYLEQLSPDVMMYHQDQNIDSAPLRIEGSKVVKLSKANAAEFKFNKSFAAAERSRLQKVTLAAVVATEYLQKHLQDYDIYLVDYMEDGELSHVYAFKKSLGIGAQMVEAIEHSFDRNSELSYYQMISLRDQQKARM